MSPFEEILCSLLRETSPYIPTELALRVDVLLTLPVCSACGQRDLGQTGEYPCPQCGLSVLHDDREKP